MNFRHTYQKTIWGGRLGEARDAPTSTQPIKREAHLAADWCCILPTGADVDDADDAADDDDDDDADDAMPAVEDATDHDLVFHQAMRMGLLLPTGKRTHSEEIMIQADGLGRLEV